MTKRSGVVGVGGGSSSNEYVHVPFQVGNTTITTSSPTKSQQDNVDDGDASGRSNMSSMPVVGRTSSSSLDINQHHQENEVKFHPISCRRCKLRHTKCDRKIPTCGSCRMYKLECMYEKPKKLRKNYNVECIDLNTQDKHHMHASTQHEQPKSKYKVYKFKVKNKTIQNASTDEKQIDGDEQKHVECEEEEGGLEFRKALKNDVRLFANYFLESSLGYYSKYISFGNDILTRADVQIIIDLSHSENLQLFPDDLLALMYIIHALTLYFKEEHQEAEEYYSKCMHLLEEDGSNTLCLSTMFETRTFFFTSNKMDFQSIFFIGTRLILCQYQIALGNLEEAVKLLRCVDVMLDERYPVFKDQSFLAVNPNDIPSNLFDGLSKVEIQIIKKRIHCGILLDELKFNLEELKGFIDPDTIGSVSLFNFQTFILREGNSFPFNSFVNRCVFGYSLDIRGKCKYEVLCLLRAHNIIYRNQPNIPFLIMGIEENNAKHLEEETLELLGMRKVQAVSLNGSSLNAKDYNEIVMVLQKVHLTSCSLLLLHEIIINSSKNVAQEDKEIVEKCKQWRNDFADELSDYYQLLPTETISICVLVISVFLVASIHAEQYKREIENKTPPPISLMRRMASDWRLLNILKRKFSKWFGTYHEELCENIRKIIK